MNLELYQGYLQNTLSITTQIEVSLSVMVHKCDGIQF